MLDNFWDHVEEYRKLGYDPLRWIASCSGEVDLHDFRAATQEVKKTSVRVSPSWFDAFPYAEGKVPELTRRVYDFASPVVDKEIEVKRALAVFRVLSGTAEQPHIGSKRVLAPSGNLSTMYFASPLACMRESGWLEK